MSDTSTTKTNTAGVDIRFLTVTALFIALTYVFTAFINVRLPIAANGGLIHLGNVPLFICAILFGKKSGAIAGGVGMGLFDLLSGWTAWAPFTFIIVAVMGFAVGAITEKHHGLGWDALAIAIAAIIKVVGYYIAEIIIYGNWLAPMASIPGNLVQIGVAAVIVLIIVEPLRKAVAHYV
ncbi:MAG: ECF transporter S component [Clostridiales bacterium]|nr:ECF transporter S component [Roseburia sp.]MDD7635922.1 ECF transporter S component [Clostridiales bacterium]MDY4112533.1 ECF transporter S component [Roseburia sp.]